MINEQPAHQENPHEAMRRVLEFYADGQSWIRHEGKSAIDGDAGLAARAVLACLKRREPATNEPEQIQQWMIDLVDRLVNCPENVAVTTAARCRGGTGLVSMELLLTRKRAFARIIASSSPPAESEKDEAYRQRNHLVAALAMLYPSGIRRTDIPGWSNDWHGCCFIDLPAGQISYHYHDSHAQLFAALPPYTKEWDGHDKETVHARLAALSPPAEGVERLRHAAANPDWQQVVMNGGPPCFHIDDGKFCFRAQRWDGHDSCHKFITLATALSSLPSPKPPVDLERLREALIKIEGGWFDIEEEDYEGTIVAMQKCAREALSSLPSPKPPVDLERLKQEIGDLYPDPRFSGHYVNGYMAGRSDAANLITKEMERCNEH